MEFKKYYLYAHTRLDKNEVFYIGIGTKHKIFYGITNEYARAYSKTRNNIWHKITKKTKYTIEIILESSNYQAIKNETTGNYDMLIININLKTKKTLVEVEETRYDSDARALQDVMRRYTDYFFKKDHKRRK